VINSGTHADKGIRLFEKLNPAWDRRCRLAGAPVPGWGFSSVFPVLPGYRFFPKVISKLRTRISLIDLVSLWLAPAGE
jgi:hypothetical protein